MMNNIYQNFSLMGCRGRIASSEAFIKKALDHINQSGIQNKITIQFIDADMVLGKEHIRSAVKHAVQAFERKENICTSISMEILVYIAGETHINNAISKVGIKDGCEKMGIIVDEKVDIEELLAHLDLKRDDTVLDYSHSKLEAFGISKEEISSVDEDKRKDLVLERVAMVDVRK